VECGGYKKDFKWRSFGESNFPGRGPVLKEKKGKHAASDQHLTAG
jgi:hypothetical protein